MGARLASKYVSVRECAHTHIHTDKHTLSKPRLGCGSIRSPQAIRRKKRKGERE